MSDEAPVPPAEQIAVINRLITRPRGPVSPHRDFYEETRDEREATVLIAAIATLQQHERAMAVVEAARHLRDRFVETEARGLRSRERQFAIDILRPSLAALDDAASAAATPAGKP